MSEKDPITKRDHKILSNEKYTKSYTGLKVLESPMRREQKRTRQSMAEAATREAIRQQERTTELKRVVESGKYNSDNANRLKDHIGIPYLLRKMIPSDEVREATWLSAWVLPGNMRRSALDEPQEGKRVRSYRPGKDHDKYATAMEAFQSYGRKPLEDAEISVNGPGGGSLTLVDGNILTRWATEVDNKPDAQSVIDYAKTKDEQLEHTVAAAYGMGFYTTDSEKAKPYGELLPKKYPQERAPRYREGVLTHQIVNFDGENGLHVLAAERIAQNGGSIPDNPGYMLESYVDPDENPIFRISLVDTEVVKTDLSAYGIEMHTPLNINTDEYLHMPPAFHGN